MENNEKDFSKACEISIDLAQQASEKIMKIYLEGETVGVDYKTDHSPLTAADKASNEIIVSGLRKEFPAYAILSEEEQDNLSRLQNDYCFIIDPLDGTKEFIKRNGQFTVNIALSYQHKSVMGVIYVPASGDLYYAVKGQGSWLKDQKGALSRLHVSDITDLDRIRMVMSSSHGCKQMDDLIEKYHFKNFVRMGSSLKGCLVAKGDAEAYYRYNPTMEWDTAAMQCIAEEAGAIFRQMDGSEMLYNRENSLNEKGFYVVNSDKLIF